MKRNLVRAFLPLLLLLAGGFAAQEPAMVTGRVTAAATGAPLAGAMVRLEPLGMRAVTDARGDYRIVVPAARFRAGEPARVTAAMLGYASQTRTVALNPGEVAASFALQAQPVAIEGIVVTGAGTTSSTIRLRGSSSVGLQGRAAGVPSGHNTENYAPIDENGFRVARRDPLSTFSIDVDAASYSNVRRFLRQGGLPPKDAVRIEEMVNYFTYDYPGPRGEHPFAVVAEVGECPWEPRHRLVHIGLQGRRMADAELPPGNLVFLVDVSGSMQTPNKLPLVKQSLRLLVERLREQDRVAMVVYAGAAGLVLEPTPGSRKDVIMDAIERLQAGGSTAGGAGLRLAYDVAGQSHVAGGNNRVILATDGDFNVGVSSDAEMFRLVEEKRGQGTFLTVLGFGMGNLKDSKLEGLADRGNGNYAYIDDLAEARKVLVSEMGGTLLTIAKDVKLQVEFNPARVAAYRLIGYENRLLADEDFNDDRKDAGELGAGHSVTALYEVVPVGVEGTVTLPGVDPLRYGRPGRARGGRRGSPELLFVKLRYKQPDGERSRLLEHAVRDEPAPGGASADFRFAAAVAQFGMLLRDSEHRGRSSVDGVLELARGALGADAEGYRAEFVRLVEEYRRVAAAVPDRPAPGGRR